MLNVPQENVLPRNGIHYSNITLKTREAIERSQQSPLKTAAVVEVSTLDPEQRLSTEYPAEYSERCYRLAWTNSEWLEYGAIEVINVNNQRSYYRVATPQEVRTLIVQLAIQIDDQTWQKEELLIGSWYHIHEVTGDRWREFTQRYLQRVRHEQEDGDTDDSTQPEEEQSHAVVEGQFDSDEE